MAEPRAKTETLVGTFVLLGILILGTLVIQFGKIRSWAKGSYPLTIDFQEASGLIEGSTVRMRGAKIGMVSSKPQLHDNSAVRVSLGIEEKYSIPVGSIFRVGQASILGDKEIIITPPDQSVSGFIESGSTLSGGGPSGLDKLQNEAGEIVDETRALMTEARGAIGKLEIALSDIREGTSGLGTTMETVNNDLLSKENLANLSSALANFDRAAKTIADLGDDAGPVLADAREAIAEIKSATRTAKNALAKVEPALEKVPQTLNSIEKTVDQAGDALASVQRTVDNKDSALSALTNDKETKDDTQAFIKNLRKYGILRYKDKETKEDDPRDRFQGRRR